MAAIPYALSIHHFISSVGADAGFAAIIGLAILVLLFFSQARETSNLRRRADEAEQQLHQLATYVEQMSRTPAPAPAPASAQTTGHPVAAPPAAARLAAARAAGSAVPAAPVPAGAVATIPVAPAGVGAPALSAATRLIPVGDSDPISIRALKPSSNGQSSGDGGHTGAAVAAPPSPPPSTAAGAANGVAHAPATPPPAAPPSAAPATAALHQTPPPSMAPRRPTPPPGRPPVGPPPRRAGGSLGGRRVRGLVLALAGALAVAAVIVALLLVTSSSNNSTGSSSTAAASRTNSSTTAQSRRHRASGKAAATAAPVTPASVTVAVLNGTSTTNLAHDVMGKLTGAGYKQGQIATASDQTLTSTIVGYTQSAYRRDALAVAKSLSLGPASVQAVSPGDRTVACSSSPSSCSAQVVVTVGADLAPNG
jgi:hypothetical protein